MRGLEDEFQRVINHEVSRGLIHSSFDTDDFFSNLEKAFPVSGSRIAWAHVPGSISSQATDRSNESQMFFRFFLDMVDQYNLSGDVAYAGDGYTEGMLSGPISEMTKHLPELLSYSQHHYLSSPNYSWCFFFSFEGDMNFGFRPSPF